MNMKKINVIENYIIGTNFSYDSIKTIFEDSNDTVVVCFENNFSDENYYLKFLNEQMNHYLDSFI